MSINTYQIKMEEEAHRQLKARAKDYNLNIGDFVEQLLSSFEIRLRTLLKITETEEHNCPNLSEYMEASLIAGKNAKDFSKEFKLLHVDSIKLMKDCDSSLNQGWKPQIKPPGGDAQKSQD